MGRPHVLIVGAGVLGASLANALARRSATVTVIDAAAPATGASSTSFAWFNAQNKRPESYFALNQAGIEEYHRLAADGIGRGWLHAVGNVEIATDDASADRLLRTVDDLAARDYGARTLSAAEATELEPLIDAERVVAAAHFPSEGWIDAPRMVDDMLTRATGAGATVRAHTSAVGFTRGRSGVVTRLSTGDELHTDFVFCAVGAATQRLLAGCGVSVPLVEEDTQRARPDGEMRYPAVGGLAETTLLRTPMRRVLHAPNLGVRPSGSGRAVLAGDGAGSRVPRTDRGIFATGPMLLDRARAYLPALDDVRLERVSMGVRPLPADGLTVAGFVDGMPGLYVAVTHSGVTLAPVLARLVAAELLDGQDSEQLKDFRPHRFPRRTDG
jgi:glycine/D-amino acid oxidase-like deaminating enzyme